MQEHQLQYSLKTAAKNTEHVRLLSLDFFLVQVLANDPRMTCGLGIGGEQSASNNQEIQMFFVRLLSLIFFFFHGSKKSVFILLNAKIATSPLVLPLNSDGIYLKATKTVFLCQNAVLHTLSSVFCSRTASL